MPRSVIFWLLFGAVTPVFLWGGARAEPARPLRVAVGQVGVSSSAEENLAKILEYIRKAAAEKCRLVVFPEGALRDMKEPEHPETLARLQAIAETAAAHRIYVVLGAFTGEAGRRGFNWMVVFDPEGREIFRYTKLYDRRRDSDLPRVFLIDGIRSSAIICADRWLRAVEDLPVMDGARISFELSDNFGSEWVPGLGWYWYAARARRNNIYVVFANTAASADLPDRHGHSAVLNPDGNVVAASRGGQEELLVVDLDLALATRAEAERRRDHPVFSEFWSAGAVLRRGESVDIQPWTRYESPEVDITIAAAQMTVSDEPAVNIRVMERMIDQAARQKADIVVFPELAVTGGERTAVLALRPEDLSAGLLKLQEAARKRGLYVIFGAPGQGRDRPRNSAYVLGPDGAILTRYDQMVIDDPHVFEPGNCPQAMWFRVKGVPAIVTIGRELLWNEIAEMAAHAGAQLLINLSSGWSGNTLAEGHRRARPSEGDRNASPSEEEAVRLPVAAGFASFRTFTAIVGRAAFGGTSIWDDLSGAEEIRAAVNHENRPLEEAVGIYSPFSANCVVRAGREETILYAKRRVRRQNSFREDSVTPRMKPWYSLGARTITGCPAEPGKRIGN